MRISSWVFLIFIHAVQVGGMRYSSSSLGWNEYEVVGSVGWSRREKQTWRWTTSSWRLQAFTLTHSAPKWVGSIVSWSRKTNLVRVKANDVVTIELREKQSLAEHYMMDTHSVLWQTGSFTNEPTTRFMCLTTLITECCGLGFCQMSPSEDCWQEVKCPQRNCE